MLSGIRKLLAYVNITNVLEPECQKGVITYMRSEHMHQSAAGEPLDPVFQEKKKLKKQSVGHCLKTFLEKT